MKYIANPVEAEAGRIRSVVRVDAGGSVTVMVDWGDRGCEEILTPEMLSRYTPVIGDYLVEQADGYRYVNPKDVFERKYRKAGARICVVTCFQCGKPINAKDFLKCRGCTHAGCTSRDLAFIPADSLLYGEEETGKLYSMSGERVR